MWPLHLVSFIPGRRLLVYMWSLCAVCRAWEEAESMSWAESQETAFVLKTLVP